VKRSGFVRKPGKVYATLSRGTGISRAAKPMKRTSRKPTVAEGSKYIAACRGEECYLRVPGVCVSVGWASPCVVDCHSNQLRHGKGRGIKADNIFTVPGCGPCHRWIDQNECGTPKQVKFDVWDRGYERWLPVRAAKMGLPLLEAA
jgi:hypothetical protein